MLHVTVLFEKHVQRCMKPPAREYQAATLPVAKMAYRIAPEDEQVRVCALPSVAQCNGTVEKSDREVGKR